MFESLVRPFQKTTTSPTRRVVAQRTEVEVTEAGTTWGDAGTLPEATEVPAGESPLDISFEVRKTKRQDEVSRETERVKVTNPDDPSQYVVVERVKKISFKEKDPEAVAAYPQPGGTSTSTVVSPGSGVLQPGETQVHTDGSGVLQPGESQVKYAPLKVEQRDYYLNNTRGPNEVPLPPSSPEVPL